MARNYWNDRYHELDTQILPKFEVILNDLKECGIASYLISRDFKIKLTMQGDYVNWKEVFDQVKSQCKIISVGTNQDLWYATDTLAVYLNALENKPELEGFITDIICGFIENSNFKQNFRDIEEDAELLNFKEENLNEIRKSIKANNLKSEMINPQVNKFVNSKSFTKVFIVHGHDIALKNEVARLIEQQGLQAIILHEQASGGKTIIEKIESYSDVNFGIVLYTPCDVGSTISQKENLSFRARQNVVFEHGYLIGKIGRENVAAIVKGNIETPGDVSGIIYISYEGNWKLDMLKEIKNCGYNIDLNKLL